MVKEANSGLILWLIQHPLQPKVCAGLVRLLDYPQEMADWYHIYIHLQIRLGYQGVRCQIRGVFLCTDNHRGQESKSLNVQFQLIPKLCVHIAQHYFSCKLIKVYNLAN